MNHLRGRKGCAVREVLLLNKRNLESALGGISCDCRSLNAAADDKMSWVD